jgi:hypothetical protein
MALDDSSTGRPAINLVAGAPIFASAIALTFDVGYFSGIDINYFTLFSLSEHLVFALEALPLAFPVVAVFLLYMFAFKWGELRSTPKRDAKITKATLRDHLHKFWVFEAFILLLLTFSIFRHNAVGIVVGFGILIAGIVMRLAPWFFLTTAVLFTYGAIFLLTLTFVAGYEAARTYLAYDFAPQVLSMNDRELHGKLIRSGERGILFHDISTREILFLKWDNIKSIRNQAPRVDSSPNLTGGK